MFQFVRGIALVATLLATCEVSLAQPEPATVATANFVMPGCREAEINRTEDIAYKRGLCMGIVSAACQCYQLPNDACCREIH